MLISQIKYVVNLCLCVALSLLGPLIEPFPLLGGMLLIGAIATLFSIQRNSQNISIFWTFALHVFLALGPFVGVMLGGGINIHGYNALALMLYALFIWPMCLGSAIISVFTRSDFKDK